MNAALIERVRTAAAAERANYRRDLETERKTTAVLDRVRDELRSRFGMESFELTDPHAHTHEVNATIVPTGVHWFDLYVRASLDDNGDVVRVDVGDCQAIYVEGTWFTAAQVFEHLQISEELHREWYSSDHAASFSQLAAEVLSAT